MRAHTFTDTALLAEKMNFLFATQSPGLVLECLIYQNIGFRMRQFSETFLEIITGTYQ